MPGDAAIPRAPMPDAVERVLRIGGVSARDLRARLDASGVRLNAYACRLFDDDRFAPATEARTVTTVEVCVGGLGLPDGGPIASILACARARGLATAPLEVGPHLRLAILDQPEGAIGRAASSHRAPPGSLTVVSVPLDDDPRTPRGFYLRRIDGALWLRGFVSGPEHVYAPQDRLVFVDARGRADAEGGG